MTHFETGVLFALRKVPIGAISPNGAKIHMVGTGKILVAHNTQYTEQKEVE